MRSWLVVLALILPSSLALAEDTRIGKVREVVGGPGSRAELAGEDGKTYVLRGLSPAADDELKRLTGMKVKFTGTIEPSDRLAVDRFEILDAGGGFVPRLGVIAELMMAGERRLIFVDDAGRAAFLPNGFTAKLKDSVGARVWLVGTSKEDKLLVTRFGVLRPGKASEAALKP